jgi:small-conductance mechanosensitive channel
VALLFYAVTMHNASVLPQTPGTPSPGLITPTVSPTASPQASPPALQEEAPVMVNSVTIIKVRADSGHSAAERARIIEGRLADVLKRARSAPAVDIATVEDTPVIRSGGIYIISVTNSDAMPLRITVSELAATWRDELEKGLSRAWHERSSGYTKEALVRSGLVIFGALVLNILLILIIQRWLKIPGFLFTLIIWLCVVAFILWLFPDSRVWSKSLLDHVVLPVLAFFLTVLIVALLFKPADSFVDHLFDTTTKLRARLIEQSQRSLHRLTMLRVVVKMVSKAALIIIAGFLYLNSLQIDITTALAGAGIIGVGLGIAAQDLLKDYLGGFFIVLEDQFAVGDVIRTGEYAGTVEGFTLRITRLRDMEGRLITIPNSVIKAVENYSSEWSQVDCSVSVSRSTDLPKAMNIIVEVAKKLRDEWPDKIIDSPEMLGVEAIEDSGVRLRMVVKTAPLTQWKVKRELLLRIKTSFDREGIEIPFPQRSLWMRSEGSAPGMMPEGNNQGAINESV